MGGSQEHLTQTSKAETVQGGSRKEVMQVKRGEWEGSSQPSLSSHADIWGTGPRKIESSHNPLGSEFLLPHPYFSSRQGKNKVWILYIHNFIYI